MMDSWLKLFDEHLRPNHEKYSIPIQASWVNADRTEFIWARGFDSMEAIQTKEAEYY